MTTLLSVETSGALCSLAIYAAGRWFEDTRSVERLHNQVVLGHLDVLADGAGVGPGSFDAVAFGAGPGSFTGIRIAAAVCQGVAFACSARALPVSSSRALATAAVQDARYPAQRPGILTVTRSRRDAYYLGGYRFDGCGFPLQTHSDRLHQGEKPPADLPDAGWIGTGDRPEWWPQALPFLDGVVVTAVTVGELALAALDRGEGVAPGAALPMYVAGDSPWRPAGG
jgi:tRNA threonylcarbamoyladenosine biosynthesis protein TsaB